MVKDEGSSSAASSPLQFFPVLPQPPGVCSPYTWLTEPSEERGLYLIRFISACAYYVAAGSLENANIGLEQISHLTSPDGDPIQRMVAYFTEALADRVLRSWPGLYKALNSTKIVSVDEEILVQRLFYELCPFLKLAYAITNQAIFEAMEGEKMIHIVDLNSSQPAQMIDLLQTLSARPEGPPHLRITGIHEHKDVLEQMSLRLTEEAEKLDIPFQFNPVVSKLENLDIGSLRVKSGEALAVSSVLQLHSLLATDDEMPGKNSPLMSAHLHKLSLMNQRPLKDWLEKDSFSLLRMSPDSALSPLSLSASPRMGSFLSALWDLSPKVMVVTEQESNHNSYNLLERISEALFYYGALFDCLDSTVPRTLVERQKVEKMLFGEEIKNIVACERFERTKRHEKLEKWSLRLELAGFSKVPLSYQGMMQATRLLRQSHVFGGYKIIEEKGCSMICWHDRPLFSVSAWRFKR
ncbi:hypothetical protein L484_008612 [Morus notabilis]|uniref:Uncharacterized protein n=1 Tax=Morus notabilis TaxID=981085 RepID=W9RTX8_9ROSA|nr:scarecrow-like protein 3 [Morus notabilis]XP_024028049.1 scarecrow-like protein 3 [Morus notabilis]EXC10446.1 hypothetical protein L484_008612 [Morus notabilis]